MLSIFSTSTSIIFGIVFLILFSLSVQMAEGATFSVVPFINKKAIGVISGIVGAGGNVGAFLAAMLLKSKSAAAEKMAIAANQGLGEEAINTAQAAASSLAVSNGYLIIGFTVIFVGALSLLIKFSTEENRVDETISNNIGELKNIKVTS
jgi:NNP family nitrate/nitrite transporter-like MFS transporter